MNFIGLDIGTSGVKALCMDENGRVEKGCRAGYGFLSSGRGRRELDPESVWRAVLRCLGETGGGREIETVTVSALGEAVIAVDAFGRCLSTGITGTDERGREQYKAFMEKAGSRKVAEITGLPPSPLYSIGKILWMKEAEPEVFERIHKVFTFQDFVIYRLCGFAAVDASMASRTMLLDHRIRRWSPWLFEQAGLPVTLMSEVVDSGTVVGVMGEGLRRELSIKGKVRITAGCHDHIANALGAGVCRAGECVNAAGTTEGLTAVMEKGVLGAAAVEKYQVACEPFAIPGLYNTVAFSNASGSVLKWFVKDILKAGDDMYEILGRSIRREPSPVLTLPHFAGAATPCMDEHSRGALLGLTLEAGREEIYQALVEGTQMELGLIYKCLREAKVPICRIAATGGMASEVILQMKADILGCEIYTPDCRETGAAGGAILGAAACGVYRNPTEAADHMVREKRRYYPDKKRHEAYKRKQEIYNGLYGLLREVNKMEMTKAEQV